MDRSTRTIRWALTIASLTVVAACSAGAAQLESSSAATSTTTTPNTTTTSTTTAEPSPTATESPVAVASAFLIAHLGTFDVDEAFSYLGADPATLGMATLDEERLLARFLEATGSEMLDLQCDETSESAEGTVVRCSYQTHSFFSDELGLGPYGPDWADLTVADGKIVALQRGFAEVREFSEQIWEPFAAWVGANYPEDRDVMYDPYPTGWRITDESIPLWELHLKQYVGSKVS